MDTYYETKKRQGFIFTLHNMNPAMPYENVEKKMGRPIEMPEGASYWSRLSGRYRNADEQVEFVKSGFVDKKLPRVKTTMD